MGLSEKILDGYRQLVTTYEAGDQIYLFGFSRGAYTARSLVGLIRNGGLLKPEHIDLTNEAYGLYRTRDEGADSDSAKLFRDNFSRVISIHMLGIWDTVGAWACRWNPSAGSTRPITSSMTPSSARSSTTHSRRWPSTSGARIISARCGTRRASPTSAWSRSGSPVRTPMSAVATQTTTCRISPWCGWSTRRSNAAWRWIPARPPSLPTTTQPITNSYKEFLGGAYSQLTPPYYRDIGNTPFGQEAIDPSVEDRLKHDAQYKPKNPVGGHLTGNFTPVGKIR